MTTARPGALLGLLAFLTGVAALVTPMALAQQGEPPLPPMTKPEPLAEHKDAPVCEVKWQFKAGSCVRIRPAVAGDLLILPTCDTNVYALERASGKERWRFKTGNAAHSSPVVAGERIYFGNDDGFVRCLNLKGEKVWELKTAKPVYSQMLLDGDTVYAAGIDKSLRAIDAATGAERWKLDLNGGIASNPFLQGGKIVLVHLGTKTKPGEIVRIDPATKAVAASRAPGGNLFGVGTSTGSPPYLVVTTYQGEILCVDAATLETKWTVKTGSPIYTHPELDGERAYVSNNAGRITAVTLATGAVAWTLELGGESVSSPRIVGGSLVVAATSGRMAGLDPATGKARYRFEAAVRWRSEPVLDADGVLYMGAIDGHFYALSPPAAGK